MHIDSKKKARIYELVNYNALNSSFLIGKGRANLKPLDSKISELVALESLCF